ncbi:unnamed protein product [Spirodela intermedia]|uniref:Uncharacterized protein n=1 Tax=Spirodela intermedia TaxID=51605 RepID=A0A7I8KL75_SPIIN|nr:unnamed protein product [Spirodela intermedia]
MKFMKLGSKPDLFQAEGDNARYVVSELPADIVVNVGEVRFFLHKFPLLSKSIHLQNLVIKSCGEGTDEVHLPDFPGGPKAFEICAKFCYGMIVVLNAHNIVAARCAAEYLEMTEDIDRGNLIFKIEVFLNHSVFRSWKDSIIVLRTTKYLLPWSEDLKIIGRCVDSITSKTSVDPSAVNWSYTLRRRPATSDEIIEQELGAAAVPRDWWVEDICDLDIDHYRKVMIGVKAKGRMSADLIGEALKAYAIRWLPSSLDDLISEEYIRWNRSLVETIIWLMPSEKGSGCSSSFLLKLLKVAVLIGAEESAREELLKRISLQLGTASVKDLLIPARPPCDTVYDVNLVQTLVDRFMAQYGDSNDSDIADEFILGGLGGLIDAYLAVIATDPNLPLSSFIDLAASIPTAGRSLHDGLYAAIDIYLKEHPSLTKADKKRLCGLMDPKKLSANASAHAAQNESLPLRVVVQVLFFEQVRAAAAPPSRGAARPAVNPGNWEEGDLAAEYAPTKAQQPGSLQVTENGGLAVEEKITSKSSKNRGDGGGGGGFLQPSRSRRIFDMLWVGKVKVENNKGSETSGSSQSPPPSENPRETKSSGSSSRQGRHSVS